MNELIETVTHYGYIVVFLGVFGEQLGLPLPSVLIVLAGGAIAGKGDLNILLVTMIATFAAFLGDTVWFQIGRFRGFQILGLLCRISLSPDSCVSGAKGMFTRYGQRSLIVAKFVPGFSTFAPPIAGATGMSYLRFSFFNAVGSILWAVAFALTGYIFSSQIEQALNYAISIGSWFGVIIFVLVAGFVGWKALQRYRLIRRLRIARITSEELKSRLDAGDEILILDLRNALDFEASPATIPTAVRFDPGDLESRHDELPRDREVVLYCTCPNEATSARTALRLHGKGILNVRPLLGGLDRWNEINLPVKS